MDRRRWRRQLCAARPLQRFRGGARNGDFSALVGGSLPQGASRVPPAGSRVSASGEPVAGTSTVVGNLPYRSGGGGEAMEARGPLLSSGWAEAFADRTRQRLLTTRQFSSPVTVAVAARTEELLSLGKREVIQSARRRTVGVAIAPSILGHCGLARGDIGGTWGTSWRQAGRIVPRR
jgi:hypothetical protein